jgi:TetR/AcrR family transcriptional regulator
MFTKPDESTHAGGQAMPSERIPRREREKLRQRTEMLDAALELFSEKGYHNVSMHEIARKSEFAIGTLYKFFKNKEDLYKALMLEKFDTFHETLVRAVEEADDEIQKLQNYVRAKGQISRDNVSVVRLYFGETRGASFSIMAGLDREIRQRYEQILEILTATFRRGIKRRRFVKIADPYSLAVALESLTNAFLFLWLEAPERHPYPENPDSILNILFKGLIAA